MKKLSSWYAFLRFEESRYRILGMQIWIFSKKTVFKYEFLWLFIYTCPSLMSSSFLGDYNSASSVCRPAPSNGELTLSTMSSFLLWSFTFLGRLHLIEASSCMIQERYGLRIFYTVNSLA